MSERVHGEVRVDGHRINFSTVGEGRPMLLIPGNSMSSERWVETGYVDRLSDHFTLILIDPLGHGESEKVTDPTAYSRKALTSHLLAVLDELGLPSVAAWGYSRGAQMLGAALLTDPDRFTRAVLGGIPLFDSDAVLRDLGLARDPAEYEAAFEKSAAGDWEAFWSVFPVPIPDDTKRFLESRNDVRAITAATRAARSEPFVFAPASVPTLAYWGDGEIFHALNVETVAGFDGSIESRAVAGGHAEAFADSSAAIAAVLPFLER